MSDEVFTEVRSHLGTCQVSVPYGSDSGGGILFRVRLNPNEGPGFAGKEQVFRLRLDPFVVQQLALQALRSRGKQAKGGPVRIVWLESGG